MERRLADVEKEIDAQKEEVKTEKEEIKTPNEKAKTQKELFIGFCEKDVIILARKILKWSVKKRGEIDGQGRQLFDPNPAV